MSFTKVDIKDNKWSEMNLKESDFNGVGEITKVAYVSDVSSGISKNGDFFITLFLKTEDGLTISSKIFNHKMILENALDLQSLKGKFIRATGMPGVYMNMYSFIISGLEEIELSKVENLEHFLKPNENLEEEFKELRGNLGQDVPEVFKIRTYSSIDNGRIGSYVSFCNSWVKQCLSLNWLLEKEQVTEMVKVLYTVIIKYEQYLQRINELDFITSIEKRQILPKISDDISHEDIIIDDCLGAIMGIGEPNHLISHIIFKSFTLSKNMEELKKSWTAMLPGGVLKLENQDVLRKY